MINAIMQPVRCQYLVKTNEAKRDNTPLNQNDLLSIGYMAGRFGVNLQNPNEDNFMVSDQNGTYVNINSCTAPLFENTLNQAGINFNRIA